MCSYQVKKKVQIKKRVLNMASLSALNLKMLTYLFIQFILKSYP